MSGRGRAMAAAVVMAFGAEAQIIQWTFGTTAPGSALPTADTVDFMSGGDVSIGNASGSTTMLGTTTPSSGYPGSSGTYSAGNAARTNAFSTASGGSAYFAFTLTPSTGYTLVVTNLSVGMRSTATGPQQFCVRSSLDGYAADLASGTITANSTWQLKSVGLAVTSTVAGAAVTFRAYGFGGSGNAVSGTVNWRIDDLTVAAFAVAAVPSTPPGIDQVLTQSVRIGKALGFGLNIVPTDGDPVTTTNVTASGVTGAWSLQAGFFSYTPSDADLGSKSFTFEVADKDGTNSMTATVNVQRRQTEAVRMTAATGSYVQSFDALAASGTANEWDNAALPFPAWYAYTSLAVTSYRTGTGSDSSGGLYSWGSGADRSLGSLASSGNDYRFGVAFTNETGQSVTNVAVSYTAEQWRVGATANRNTLAFEYCVTNCALPLNQGAWRSVPALSFESPLVTNATQAAGAAYSAAVKAASLTRPIPAGAVVLLRWSDVDDTGNDHGLGIDDLTVTWAAGALRDALAVGRGGLVERFDDLGGAAGAELPYLWRVESRDDAPRVSGSYASASDRTQFANAVVNFTYAGSYNFAASVAGDQAVGGLSSSNTARTVTLFGKFRSAAAMPLRRWSVRYAVEKYRNGQSATAVRLLASTDGATWSEAGAATVFAADADDAGYAADARPGAAVAVSREVVFPSLIPDGGVFYLAWQVAVAEGSDTTHVQALGVDDVEVAPVYPRGTMLRVL